ncbi:MAG TPA: hypothetical protein VF808_04175 [Ktedonobacterales bacterium]
MKARTSARRWALAGLALVVLVATVFIGASRANDFNALHWTPLAGAAASSATATQPAGRPFEQGVVYPKWGATVYGINDASWAPSVQSMRQRTGARWVEMIVSLDQNGYSATQVYAGSDTLQPDDLYVGILSAREAGLQVFIEPLLNVRGERDNWSGRVNFPTHAQAQAWFQSYWQAYQPYVRAARQAGASQISIAAEYDTLQSRYPDLWTWLARKVKSTFHGPVTYDANHTILGGAAPAWMRDHALSYIGVSMYYSLQTVPRDVTEPQIVALWQRELLPLLDRLSAQVGKQVVLSEIGYRDATDALRNPWTWRTSAPADPALQGAAYAAALAVTASDPHIAGLYFWGWNVGQFTPGPDAIYAMRAAWL